MQGEVQDPPNGTEPAEAVTEPEPFIFPAKGPEAQQLHDVARGGQDHIQIPEIQGDGRPDRAPQDAVHGTAPGGEFIAEFCRRGGVDGVLQKSVKFLIRHQNHLPIACEASA